MNHPGDSKGVSRREVLLGLAGLGAAACGGEALTPAPRPDLEPPPPPDLGPPAPEPEPTYTTEQLLASIDAVVVVMMENRSFDHYFGMLRQDPAYAQRAQVEGLRGDERNLDPSGQPVGVYNLQTFTAADPPHDWDSCHRQWNNGRNDGFVTTHAGPDQRQVMGYYLRDQLPFFYALADRYTLCDRWYASVLGPTWPNRFYLHSCTSKGKRDNTPFLRAADAPDTIWERLSEKGLRGKNYHAGAVAFYTGGYVGKALGGNSPTDTFANFLKDARAGALPPLSIIDPDFLLNDDHPAHDIQLGQAFLSTVVQALAQSPQWSRSLLLITYDEHGGFFDHVAPPLTADPQVGFSQLGMRVPSLVIGPTVRRGALCSTPFDHCSVAATIGRRFGVRSLGPRMDLARDLSPVIDPRLLQAPAPPPADLPKVALRMERVLEVLRARVHSQGALERMAQEGLLPRARPDADLARTRAWLDAGAALGALEVG